MMMLCIKQSTAFVFLWQKCSFIRCIVVVAYIHFLDILMVLIVGNRRLR